MKLIGGYLFALFCIFGGFMLAGGKMGPILAALPIEMMIIFGEIGRASCRVRVYI